jgi:hypothetical protein
VVTDRLCEFVRGETKLNCVVTLAADTFVHPGSIVDYQPSEQPMSDRIPLPVADLLGQSCLVPGSTDLVKALGAQADVSIPTLTYKTNSSLTVGADVELPKLYGTIIKAGPNWSAIQKVDLSADAAWITQFDENLAVRTVKSCKIRKECVDRILSHQYRVIGTALIAKGLSYTFYDESGQAISLDAAMKQKAFTTNIGVDSHVKQSTDASLKSSDPRVVGLKFLPTDVFTGQQVCDQTIIFNASGSAEIAVSGGGGKGHITPATTSGELNKPASLSRTGTERSECDDGFERNVSSSSATALVKATNDGKMFFSYKINTHGGHYVTAASCLQKLVIGKTGHDNTANASVNLKGTIYVTIRSEETPNLKISWEKMPPKGIATLKVTDWNGEPLLDKEGKLQGAISATDDGDAVLQTRGPGIYRVQTSVTLEDSIDGQQGRDQSAEASVAVSAGN